MSRKSPLRSVSPQPTYVMDNIVFDIIGLTKGERDSVYEAVVELVKNRLEKARSIN